MKAKSGELHRALGLFALTVYGLGDILGAGIYAVTGKVAGQSGTYAWAAFAVAMAVAFLTALCYAELGSRHPVSGGASVYVDEAFGRPALSFFTGWLVFCSTIVSMATLTHAFLGYLRSFGLSLHPWILILGFLLILMGINLRGIRQSSWANMLSTAIELSGLLLILIFGAIYLFGTGAPATPPAVEVPASSAGFIAILQGASLAFFAFTGFEDLANVAEEVKEPEKNLPRAILFSLGCAGFIYITIAWISTSVITPAALGHSTSPLLDVINKAYPPLPSWLFSVIALFSVANTALLNYVTGSRLLYGMAEKKLLPVFLGRVHGKFRTPYLAIFVMLPIVFVLAILGNLTLLASSTSALILTIFTLVNISLIRIHRESRVPKKAFHVPAFVPWVAAFFTLAALAFLPWRNFGPAVVLVGVGLLLAWHSTRRRSPIR